MSVHQVHVEDSLLDLLKDTWSPPCRLRIVSRRGNKFSFEARTLTRAEAEAFVEMEERKAKEAKGLKNELDGAVS